MDKFKIPSAMSISRDPESDVVGETAEMTKDTTIREKSVKNSTPYKIPEWSGKPNQDTEYKFEVLKSGVIIEEIKHLQQKAFWTFGRLENNDISMAHPTISRYHAVLQFKPSLEQTADNKDEPTEFGYGWYIYDLGSTHGTKLNKTRIPPKTYIRVRVGHMLKLGESTRCYILQGPKFDEEPESMLTITEVREMKKKSQEEEIIKQNSKVQPESEGINWGMAEDADAETDLTVNPYSLTNNEELFLDDPKKTLRGFFEREGLDLEYKIDEMSAGTFICRVELPLNDSDGKHIKAEVCHKGRKKDCVLQCALEACRILDRHGILRQSYHEPLKRKLPTDDSDDDDFLDRTGDIERKKQRKATGSLNAALTYEELIKQETDLVAKLAVVEQKIENYQKMTKCKKELNPKDDDLDSYMKYLTNNIQLDKTEIRRLRVEQQSLKENYQRLQRLIKIATPVQLPSISNTEKINKKTTILPLFGKRSKLAISFTKSQRIKSNLEEKCSDEEAEEVEERESEEVISVNYNTSTKTNDAGEKADSELANNTDLSKQNIIGPAVSCTDILLPKKLVTGDHNDNEGSTGNDNKNAIDNSQTIWEEDISTKKRKTRMRIRPKCRENIDIDDKMEIGDTEKYSDWIPPENQCGDGLTPLNEKFGY